MSEIDLPAFVVFIYPVSLIALVGWFFYAYWSRGWVFPNDKGFKRCFIYLCSCYILGFILVAADPTWIDNGVEEAIPNENFWTWAILWASVVEVFTLPVLGMVLLFKRRS